MEAGFERGKWNLNSTELFSKTGNKEVNKEVINVHDNIVEKASRFRNVNWNVENSLVVFDFTNIVNLNKSSVLIKRNLLNNVFFFSPLQLISPITLQEKLF